MSTGDCNPKFNTCVTMSAGAKKNDRLGNFFGNSFRNVRIHEIKGENNILSDTPIFADRGVVTDRNGTLLAWNVPNLDNPDFALRAYTTTPGFAHVLGYVKYPSKDSSGAYYNENFQGMDGVEKYYDSTLSGQNGEKIVETNALGKVQKQALRATYQRLYRSN